MSSRLTPSIVSYSHVLPSSAYTQFSQKSASMSSFILAMASQATAFCRLGLGVEEDVHGHLTPVHTFLYNYWTPLHLARGHRGGTTAAPSAGSCRKRTDEGRLADLALYNGNLRVTRLLLGHGANVNTRGDKDPTPLRIAFSV